jgi:hypothetical protein
MEGAEGHVWCGCRRWRPIQVTALCWFLGKQVAVAKSIHGLGTVALDCRQTSSRVGTGQAPTGRAQQSAAAVLVFGLGRHPSSIY